MRRFPLLLALMLAGCGLATAPGTERAGPSAGLASRGAAIIKLAEPRAALPRVLTSREARRMPGLGLLRVPLRPGETVTSLKRSLGAAAIYVEADAPVGLADPLSVLTSGQRVGASSRRAPDPLSGLQWAIPRVRQAEAQALVAGGSAEVTVAIVDTGVDLWHPDLQAKLVGGYNAMDPDVTDPRQARDDHGHGTHCAGIAAAATGNGEGIAGMAANCKIMPVRALGGSGSGSLFTIAEGIVWAADHGADVISLSLGGGASSQALEEAVSHALARNVVLVSAMGNAFEAGNPTVYPAALPGVIAVGATDEQDRIAPFSCQGPHATISAPGVSIHATTPTYEVFLNTHGAVSRRYGYLSGTSMATPLVAGLAALIRSQHPGLAPAEVKALLERSAEKVPGMGGAPHTGAYGYGRLDAARALGR